MCNSVLIFVVESRILFWHGVLFSDLQ